MNNMMSLLGEIQLKKILQSQLANASLNSYISCNVYMPHSRPTNHSMKTFTTTVHCPIISCCWVVSGSMHGLGSCSQLFLPACRRLSYRLVKPGLSKLNIMASSLGPNKVSLVHTEIFNTADTGLCFFGFFSIAHLDQEKQSSKSDCCVVCLGIILKSDIFLTL